MELDLPEQVTPQRGGFPSTPRGLSKWLDELSHVDMREATKRFSEGVPALNRTRMRPGRRLAMMEMLRPTGREILDHLGGRLQVQTLPLPERARKVFQLDIQLLREIALGYEAALVELAGAWGPTRGRRIALAAERSLAARGELMLRCAQVYAPLPEGFWGRVHNVYGHAEAARLERRRVPDAQMASGRRPRQSRNDDPNRSAAVIPLPACRQSRLAASAG